jgi:hypothetical protein
MAERAASRAALGRFTDARAGRAVVPRPVPPNRRLRVTNRRRRRQSHPSLGAHDEVRGLARAGRW